MMHTSIRIFWNGPLLRCHPGSNQIAIAGWLTMVSEPLKMQQFKAKILRIGKIRKTSTAATLPFTPMKDDCFLLWGSRFSLPKAHHFKYPPSEAVWTIISLKVRSLAKFSESRLPQGLQTSDLTEELVFFFCSALQSLIEAES